MRRLSQKSFSEGYNEVSARFEAEALRLAPVGHGGGASSRESVSLPHPLSKVENPGFLRGRLIASTQDALMRTDLRTLVSPEDVAEAERIAERLARAMRYRLSRRRMPACRGDTIDLRRTMRRNLSRGGEPIELRRKHRPERPFRLVVLLDVSGSMKVYSRFFLSFVRGLIGQWLQADAFLFHTRFVRVTEVLRERDASRAMGRLSLMTEGFGGGTRIAASLKHFNDRYAKEALNSRSVVIIMSDGYDTDPAEALTVELNRLTPGEVFAGHWQGGTLPPHLMQERMFEAVTGIVSLDNLLVIGEHFSVWPPELVTVEVELPKTCFGDIVDRRIRNRRDGRRH